MLTLKVFISNPAHMRLNSFSKCRAGERSYILILVIGHPIRLMCVVAIWLPAEWDTFDIILIKKKKKSDHLDSEGRNENIWTTCQDVSSVVCCCWWGGEVSSHSIKSISSRKKIDLSSVLSRFSQTHLRLSWQREGCILALSSWMMWEILRKMKEHHPHGALMKSIFQHTVSLHFVGSFTHVGFLTLSSPILSHWIRPATNQKLNWQPIDINLILIWCPPCSLLNNDTELKQIGNNEYWIMIQLDMSFL